MTDWIEQALGQYLRASAALTSTHLQGMLTSLELAQHALELAADDAHLALAARVAEVAANLASAQAEINEIREQVDDRIQYVARL